MLGLDGRGQRRRLDPPPARAQGRLRAAGALHAVTARRIVPAASPPPSRSSARRRRARAAPSPSRSRSADNYYLPDEADREQGAKVEWEWPDDVAIDVHDVKLKKAPKGVKKFQSEPASSGYTYKRTFKKPGHVQDRLHAARGDDHDDQGQAEPERGTGFRPRR